MQDKESEVEVRGWREIPSLQELYDRKQLTPVITLLEV